MTGARQKAIDDAIKLLRKAHGTTDLKAAQATVRDAITALDPVFKKRGGGEDEISNKPVE